MEKLHALEHPSKHSTSGSSPTCVNRTSAPPSFDEMSNRWSLLIVRDALFAGSVRFGDWLRLGIATNILKDRLRGFVESGIMERRTTVGNPEHGEYVLTDKGRDLAPAIVALTEWGDRWAAPNGPPIVYVHAVCGGAISEQTTCANCGQVHDPAEVDVRPGPGMPSDIAARTAVKPTGTTDVAAAKRASGTGEHPR
jgi:DNA-binding HxlR family transcriptional regulator